ncbi:MAG: hypothetical protein M5U14_11705 [Acidimicrobiia bacterium]|nr:hypothetical protein [Acidimicrobiia bacterium]
MTTGPPTSPERGAARVLVRVWLPDRPGALGLVASRIGAVRGDIVGVDVLERGEDVVEDEFAVDLGDLRLLDILVREIEEVDGASVEEVRIVERFPDARLDALESAALLCEATSVDELRGVLVDHIREEFLADWAALVGVDGVLASAGEAPDPGALATLGEQAAGSAHPAGGAGWPADLALAGLLSHRVNLLVGRAGHPFRLRERQQLLGLARVADRAWILLAGRPGS